MKKIQIDYSLNLNGTIIDLETTHWNAEMGEIITAGFLSQSGFIILQRLESDEDDFKKRVIKEMKTAKKPWYAFNKECEETFSGLKVDCDLQDDREAAYIALRDEGLLEYYNSLCDPLFNEEIPRFWDAWKSTKEILLISKIVRHNYCCLAKEYYLKLKRMDKLDLNMIKPFLSSAAIEKLYIRKQLGFFVE
jgi:hypothetical protein